MIDHDVGGGATFERVRRLIFELAQRASGDLRPRTLGDSAGRALGDIARVGLGLFLRTILLRPLLSHERPWTNRNWALPAIR